MRRMVALAAVAALLPAVGATLDPCRAGLPSRLEAGLGPQRRGAEALLSLGLSRLRRVPAVPRRRCHVGDRVGRRAGSGGPPDEPVTYVFHVGLNSGTSPHRFELQLDGRPLVAFDTAGGIENRAWTVEGHEGARLQLLTTRIGGFDERFGFMALTVPRQRLGGAPPRFRIVPEAAGSQDYVLVFEEPVTRVGEGGRGGGRPEGRPAAAHRRCQPPRTRRAGRGEGRGPRGPPRRARHRPHAHRDRRARGRDGVDPGRDRSRGTHPARRRGAPAPRGDAGVPRHPPLARGHRLLRPAAGGGAQAVGELPRRARALPEDEGHAGRGALPLAGRGSVGRGELPRAGDGERAARVRRGGEARRPGAARQPHERPHRPVPPRGARPMDGRLAPPEAALRDRDEPGRDAHGHPRPRVAHGHGAGASRRALLLERTELHAEPEARRRRPDRLDARGARRPALLVGLALGTRAPPHVGRRPWLLLVPRRQPRPHHRLRHARDPGLLARAHAERLPVRARPGPLHGRRGQRPGGPEAARVRGELERALRDPAARPRLRAGPLRGLRAALRSVSPREAGRPDPVLGGRCDLERGRGDPGAGRGPAAGPGRGAVGDDRPGRVPARAGRGGVAPAAPVARAHLGRRRERLGAGPPGRGGAVGVQAGFRGRGRPPVAGDLRRGRGPPGRPSADSAFAIVNTLARPARRPRAPPGGPLPRGRPGRRRGRGRWAPRGAQPAAGRRLARGGGDRGAGAGRPEAARRLGPAGAAGRARHRLGHDARERRPPRRAGPADGRHPQPRRPRARPVGGRRQRHGARRAAGPRPVPLRPRPRPGRSTGRRPGHDHRRGARAPRRRAAGRGPRPRRRGAP